MIGAGRSTGPSPSPTDRRAGGSGRGSVALQNYLAQLGSWAIVAQGAAFIFCVLVFRRGVVGELSRLLGKAL